MNYLRTAILLAGLTALFRAVGYLIRGGTGAVMVLMPATAVNSAGPQAALAPPQSFAGIGDTAARSAALFTEAGKVLTSPRCVNCHPAGDRPLQGEAGRLHQPPVERGADGLGAASM